jgi:hypothetical protein
MNANQHSQKLLNGLENAQLQPHADTLRPTLPATGADGSS